MKREKTILILTVLLLFSMAGIALASYVSVYYYRQPDNTLSASGEVTSQLRTTINILPSQTYYGDGYWGWPKNTNISQKVFTRNLESYSNALGVYLAYDDRYQTSLGQNGLSGYRSPTKL